MKRTYVNETFSVVLRLRCCARCVFDCAALCYALLRCGMLLRCDVTDTMVVVVVVSTTADCARA